MITIQEGIKVGDIAYVSFSAFKEVEKNKTTKKPIETECKVMEYNDNYIRLMSTGGEYSLFFDKRTLEMFNGNIRKA